MWCCNPESQLPEAEILYDPVKCIACGDCVRASDHGEFVLKHDRVLFDRKKVADIEIFRDICPTMAIEICGKSLTVEEVIAQVEKDIPFYKSSGGGVTLSGGEPFFYPDILLKLLTKLKELRIHTAIETCLDVPWEHIETYVPLVDVILADVKHVDQNKLNNYAKGDALQIKANLKNLCKTGIHMIARVPVIPAFNNSFDEMRLIIDFVAQLNSVGEIHFLPYHTYGTHKYILLGRSCEWSHEHLDASCLKTYATYARNKGLKVKIGG